MTFDPFNDRTARDLRNSLSTALVAEMTNGQNKALTAAVADWQNKLTDKVYWDYLQDRQKRYRLVLTQIESQGITDAYHQVCVLWNADLFFELHELLEIIWQPAKEPLKSALKGLIQAAGAYVHAHRGNSSAAQALAARAQKHLNAAGDTLVFIANLQQLIDGLQTLNEVPPKLQFVKEGAKQNPTDD